MNELNEISLEGFKVVSGDYFYSPQRLMVPSMTFWYGSIGFSKQDLILLNKCDSVLIQINSDERKIIVMPTTSSDTDGIRWIKDKKTMEPRRISCKKLTDLIYEMWKWDSNRIYRARGRLVTSANKVMLLFDFSEAESWKKPEARKV